MSYVYIVDAILVIVIVERKIWRIYASREIRIVALRAVRRYLRLKWNYWGLVAASTIRYVAFFNFSFYQATTSLSGKMCG